jgi:serine/threonine-protein kinase
MDWGLAKVGAATDEEQGTGFVSTAQTESGRHTRAGAIQGTVPYMSPEQAHGLPLERRSDIYALGAILYEILTLRQAFEGHGDELLRRVRQGEFLAVETRNLQRAVPEALAALCRRAMSTDPAARPATAREFADELRAFLDGRAEKERRHREAEALAAEGRDAMAIYVAAHAAIDASERVLAENGAKFRTWQSVLEKAPLLVARQAVDAARKKAVLVFAETTRLLEGALLAEPRNASALATLAALWRGRLDDAERRGDATDADFALTMVGRYDDGRLAAWIAGDGTLELTSDPQGVQVVLHRFEDRHGVLRLGEGEVLGQTPLAPRHLPMGSYLCVLRSPDFRDVRYPVHITRNRAWKGRVKMRSDEEIGAGFVYVPAGPFVYGEDRDAKTLELPDFTIAKSPVTFADWAEFLAAVEAEEGAEVATKLCPGTPGDGAIMDRAPGGSWRMKAGGTSGPSQAALLARHGAGFESRCPVMAISWFDALAYCEWKTRTTGRQWRLPTEEEREKAGRGVDGRRFPWGELEDASLAKCRESREEPAQPEPVGAFPAATSVYGLHDAAGGTFDWTDSWFDQRRASRAARGGAWSTPAVNIRCAYRSYNEPSTRRGGVGLRCARSF